MIQGLDTEVEALSVRVMIQGLDMEVEALSVRAMSQGLDTKVEAKSVRAMSQGLDPEVEALSVRAMSQDLDTEVEALSARAMILVPALALQPAPRPGSLYLMAIQRVRSLLECALTVKSMMAHLSSIVRITAMRIMLVSQLTWITGQIVELLRKAGAIATLTLRFQEYVQRVALLVVTFELSNVSTSALPRA
jgi:hypothetical protein